jgi:hypothetical protein
MAVSWRLRAASVQDAVDFVGCRAHKARVVVGRNRPNHLITLLAPNPGPFLPERIKLGGSGEGPPLRA